MELEDRLRSARYPKKDDAPQRHTIAALDQPDVPGSPVALTFVPDEMNRLGGSEDAWCAELPWEAGMPFYRVSAREGLYVYLRPLDPGAGSLAGTAESLEAAMLVCAEDVVRLARQQRWREHMLTHEPPKD